MAYYIDLYSPHTYAVFSKGDRTVAGFRPYFQTAAQRVNAGDRLVCYMTRLSRWVGILEIIDGPYTDSTPRPYRDDDPYTVRFHTRELVWLPLENTVPIHEDTVWNTLSFTRDLSQPSSAWTGTVRRCLTSPDEADGAFLERLLTEQRNEPIPYPVDPTLWAKLTARHGPDLASGTGPK